MSEPRHIYAWDWPGQFQGEKRGSWTITLPAPRRAKRYTLTSGPEYEELMKKMRSVIDSDSNLLSVPEMARRRRLAIASLLAYLEEQP